MAENKTDYQLKQSKTTFSPDSIERTRFADSPLPWINAFLTDASSCKSKTNTNFCFLQITLDKSRIGSADADLQISVYVHCAQYHPKYTYCSATAV